MPVNPYQNAIGSEGILQYLLAQLAAEDSAQKAGMGSQIGALIGDYGAVPGGYQDKYGVIDPAVRDLAARNPFSTIKQLERQRGQQRGSMMANRAARGVVSSGGTGLQEKEIGYNFGLQNYQALRDLMSQISGIESGYASDVRGRLGQQTEGYQSAIDRLMGAGFRPGQYTGPTASAPYGFYRDPNGVLTPKGKPKKKLPPTGGILAGAANAIAGGFK